MKLNVKYIDKLMMAMQKRKQIKKTTATKIAAVNMQKKNHMMQLTSVDLSSQVTAKALITRDYRGFGNE